MKRIFLFIATNLVVIALLSVVLHLLGADQILQKNGVDLNIQNLLVFSAVFGFGGAFISLAMSKMMAKWMMKVKVIDKPADAAEQWLLSTVQRQARQAGIRMPQVGIYNSPDMNAFATGMSKNSALVAVSSGLLHGMRQDEVEAVLAHEITHVSNGDMVTLTLVQGVVNTFVIFLSRVIGHFVDRVILKNEQGYGIGYLVTVIFLQIVLGIFASMIVAWFSRQREFRADAGGARLAGREKMIHALEALGRMRDQPAQMPEQMAAFGIRGGAVSGLRALFLSHPPLEQRIEALKAAKY